MRAMTQSFLVSAGAKTMVDLTWTYSNQPDLADLLRRTRLWLNEDRRETPQDQQVGIWARLKPAEPRRVVDRLGEDAVREMIEARRAGVKPCDVAARYGISESSVKRLVHAMRLRPDELIGKRYPLTEN